jgi:hypothetical protein
MKTNGSLYCHAGALMHDIFRNADNPNSKLFLGLICCLYSIIDSDYPCTSNLSFVVCTALSTVITRVLQII